MNKKMVISLIITSFIIIGISMVSAVDTQTKNEGKKLRKIDSPLFNIRTEKILQKKESKTIQHP